MSDMNCCRTCLVTSDLRPIFQETHKCDEYSFILQLTTGLQIKINDGLPQLICINCINIINNHTKFLEKCCLSQTILQNRTKNIETNINNHNEMEFNEIESISKSVNSDNDNDDKEIETTIEDVIKKQHNIEIKNVTPKKVKLKYEGMENVKKKVTNEKKENASFECPYCKKLLKTKCSLNGHIKIHLGRRIVCEHCGKKFMSKRRLLMHCKSKHGYEKTDKCSYCDYRGSNAELVKIHERTHTGERPYVCAQCGAAFHRHSTYLQHVPIHLPEKTVPCPDCPSLFKSVTLMRIHRSHHKRKLTRDVGRHSANQLNNPR